MFYGHFYTQGRLKDQNSDQEIKMSSSNNQGWVYDSHKPVYDVTAS